MPQPAYVSIAGEIAKKIRTGKLSPGTQLHSYSEMAELYEVSGVVIRQAVALLLSQGLVRTIPRKGTFVAERPDLVRVSPERQFESVEGSFGNESDRHVHVDREVRRVSAGAHAEVLGITPEDTVVHVITKVTEDGRPISISDTYQPVARLETAPLFLEEAIADRHPTADHASWLGTAAGDLVKTVHQRFLSDAEDVVMISNVSYPRDRYSAFVFRMKLDDGREAVTWPATSNGKL
ncbi:GntR family transcriptional regulator [Nocardia australiensis]|uniref:GntR family transcriptional regulator n=1 Tax=Nocardia australiensis TaxID=2887191 RepID=UPI001D14208D|nr:GntR family transcriptional regulator [Nocardia australiensis]